MRLRPNQHPELFNWAESEGLDRDKISALLRYLLAPPNLKFLFTILDRLAHLQSQWPDQLGSLPAPFEDPNSISQLRDSLKSAVGKLDIVIAQDFSAPPAKLRKASNPFYGYCLSTFPLWCTLIIAPENAESNKPFERVLACLIGELMWFIADSIPHESYEAFLDSWQQAGEISGQETGYDDANEEKEEITEDGTSNPMPHISSLAKAERTLRKLTRPEFKEPWRTIQEKFPSSFMLQTLASRLPKIAGVHADVAEHFQVLASVLALYQNHEKTSVRKGAGGHRGRWKDLNDGRYLEGQSWLIQNDIPPFGSKNAGALNLNPLPTNVQELLDEDYCPDELTDTCGGLYFHKPEQAAEDMPESALRIINKWHFQQNQAQNQILEWDLEALTSVQMDVLLEELQFSFENDDESSIIAKMLLHASFVSSRKLEFIARHFEITRPSAQAGANIDFIHRENSWRLTIKKPSLNTPDAHRAQGNDEYVDFLLIPDVLGFRSLMSHWLDLHPDFGERKKVFPESEDARDEVRMALSGINGRLKRRGITFPKIASALARRVNQEHCDLAWTALWSDWQPAHSRTLLHYLSPEIGAVERVIRSSLLKLSRQTDDEKPPYAASGKVRRTGMPNCPSQEQVRTLIGAYQEILKKDPGRDLVRIREYSNHYMAYHVLFQTAALGYRSSIDPSPLFSEIDGLTLAIFRDKDSEGYNRRIVPTPRLFREHLSHFQQHRSIVRGAFIDECLAQDDPQIIWFDRSRVIPFQPKFVFDTPPAYWNFKINALRRRMRTRLLENGAPGDVVDAWMGHWKIGDCPWMSGSGFQMGELEAMVNRFVQEVLLEDGWTPIPSMLRDGI